MQAIHKVFQSANLSPAIAANKNKVQAWVYVVCARKALEAGQSTLATDNLGEAFRLDPGLNGEGRVEMLEFLLSPQVPGGDGLDARAPGVRHVSAFFGIEQDEVRRALARVAMSQFFKLARDRRPETAMVHLVSGIRFDPGWIANRGVLAFFARYAFNRIVYRSKSSG